MTTTLTAPVIRALDLGYGNTKFVTRSDAGGVLCRMFPSLAPMASATDIASGVLPKRDTVIIPVGEHRYEVGPDSILVQGRRTLLHSDYTQTEGYRALCVGALHYMAEPIIDMLVVGLPVSLHQLRSGTLIKALKGRHEVADGRAVEVRQVWVLPQPLGGFFSLLAESRDRALASQTNLIIDPGFMTTDWMVGVGPKPVDHRSGSHPVGMSAILRAAAQSLSTELGEHYDNLDALDRGIREGIFRVHGTPIDVSRHFDAARPQILEAIDAMLSSVGGLADIDNIILVGGGARVFLPLLQARFPSREFRTVEEPVFANVRGFQLAGEQRLARARG